LIVDLVPEIDSAHCFNKNGDGVSGLSKASIDLDRSFTKSSVNCAEELIVYIDLSVVMNRHLQD